MTLGGVAHDFTDVVLRVEAAVRLAVVHAFPVFVVASDEGFAAFGADLRQPGIFPDLDAPSLVVGQMPVEFIQFVKSHHIQQFLHFFFSREMTGNIQHQPSPTETGCISDLNSRNTPINILYHRWRLYLCRQKLAKGFNTGNNTAIGISLDLNFTGSNVQRIGTFILTGNITYSQRYITVSLAYIIYIAG